MTNDLNPVFSRHLKIPTAKLLIFPFEDTINVGKTVFIKVFRYFDGKVEKRDTFHRIILNDSNYK